jgi:prohibitin 2
MANIARNAAGAGIFGMAALYLGSRSIFTVDPGNKALIFNRIGGLKPNVLTEGFHVIVPYFQWPVIYDVKTRPRNFQASTSNRDLQSVNITVRVLYRPDGESLSQIHRYLGPDYDERVLPSIVNEVLRTVVAKYNAAALLSQRDQVSSTIRNTLEQRAKQFHIILDDVSITHLTFGKEFSDAIEAKQVAQQIAERAKYIVDQAREDKKSIIIKAQAEATSAELIGKAVKDNPTFLELRRIETAREIAGVLAESRNHIMLNSNQLLLSLGGATKTK